MGLLLLLFKRQIATTLCHSAFRVNQPFPESDKRLDASFVVPKEGIYLSPDLLFPRGQRCGDR